MRHTRGRMTCMLRLLVVALAAMALGAVSAADAHAIEITHFEAGVSRLDAGAHADAHVSFRLATGPTGGRCLGAIATGGNCIGVVGGAPSDIVVELPKGLVGNPQAAARCLVTELSDNRCPVASQVGYAELYLLAGGVVNPDPARAGVFNMVPERGEVAKFGMLVSGATAFISASVRNDGDYGLTTTTSDIYTGVVLWGVDLTMWGVPGDPSHYDQRQCYANGTHTFPDRPTCTNFPVFQGRPLPFMTNPPECGVPGSATIRINSYQDPTPAVATSEPQTLGNCDRQAFQPTLSVSTAEPTERGAPWGLNVDIDIPQTYDNPNGLATPPLRNAVVTLPQGTTISPSSADGLQACTDAQLGVGTSNPVACPQASRIGDVTLETPLLAERLGGGIYLGNQLSHDPASGDLFRIALELENRERGLTIKIGGRIHVDPDTGLITARFTDNPQLPFSKLQLRFKAGPRAPLGLPTRCGPATVSGELLGWGMAQPAPVSSTFEVTHNGSGAPCPQAFAPVMDGGSTDPVGKKDTSFTLSFGRPDGQQDLKGLTVEMPPGLLARIADVPLCPAGLAAAGACGEGSRVGRVTTASGPGTQPLYLPGRVYLSGAYRGAPYSLSIVVPAVAGPFDLGTVVVRAAIYVDRNDASLTIVSDDLPWIVKGVILRIQRVTVDIDRPRFMVNPSNCSPMSIDGVISSVANAVANVRERFQVGDCANLPVRPRMTLTVGGRGHIGRDRRTPLTATLTQTPSEANLKSVRVTLPRTINARLDIVRRACTLEAFRGGTCSADALIGSGTAVTPLLRDPLTGPAYFVRNPARRLPDIMVALRGPVEFDLTGKVSIPRDLTLTTEFDAVPDVPISRFTLRLVAGRNGPIGNVSNLCSARARRARGRLVFRGQNGRVMARSQRLRVKGCRARSRGTSGSRRAGARRGRRAEGRARGGRTRS